MKSIKIDGRKWEVNGYVDYFGKPTIELSEKKDNLMIQLSEGESCEFVKFDRFVWNGNEKSYFIIINNMEIEL